MNKAIQLVNGMKSKRHQLNKLSEIKTKRERESTLSITEKRDYAVVLWIRKMNSDMMP